eukprot:TRINITY_DN25638_c0_g1_i1.p1 TRINITY_DN25638_c0_g1~~TRINITY_DN25638_c0_g1_i1.p1  ORF type:complete len:107 (+),score=16.91 TRINITY_DN25638_c0_g1_i1:27-323(+)
MCIRDSYPDVLEHLQRSCMRFFLHDEKTMDFKFVVFKFEDRFRSFKNSLSIGVEELYAKKFIDHAISIVIRQSLFCLLYTSDAADDLLCVDLGGRRII